MALAIDRREGTGLGLAVLGHVILLSVLAVGLIPKHEPEKLQSTPIEISLTDEAGLVSEAPEINREAPAERFAEAPAPPEPLTPPPVERPEPEPVVRPDPAPPKAEPRPAPKPEPKRAEPKKASAAPPKAQPRPTTREVRPTGRLSGIVDGLTDQPSKGKAKTPQATQIGAAVKSSLAAEVIRQLRPHWRSPTGADVELLRTTVEIRLNRDGSLASPPRVVAQTGVNASNRAQADLHKERALNAARLAAPFNLPEEYYDAWKILRPNFDRNLSR
jgi:outer membrane biosynthesis protein TonB